MARTTEPKLAKAIDSALGGGDNPPLVYIPPGKRTETKIRKPTNITAVRDNLIRIEHEADPIGFLIAAMNGAAFEVNIITEAGGVLKLPAQASMKDRVKIAMYLADKLTPNLHLHRHIAPPGTPGGDGASGSLPGAGMTFAQMVAKAANNHEHAPPSKVTTIDQETEE